MLPPFECCLVNLILHESFIMGYLFTHSEWRTSFYNVSFVNKIVETVETRKTFTKDKNLGDKIDAVLTNKWLGIPIFAVVMFLVFQISHVWVGTPIAELLVGWM